MERGKVDLRKCKKGDLLIGIHGGRYEYIEPANEFDYYDHYIQHIDKSYGPSSRTHDGYTFRNKRIPETDDDIIKIISVRKLKLKKIEDANKKITRISR